MRRITLFFILFYACPNIAQTRVYMTNEGNGVFTIPCKVNGLPLKFIFDTGASDVVISLSEARFMLKNGYLNSSDIIGTSYAQIANGQITKNTKIMLKEIEIQGLKLYNVTAAVIHELSAPLLLGQSAIQKLGKIQLDGNELTIYSGINTNFECSINNIMPFKIGMSDLDISLFVIKNQEYSIAENSYPKRHYKDYIDYLKKEVDKGFIVVNKKIKNCINANVTFRLYLVNDYLYKIEFDFGVGSSDEIEQMNENYEFLKSILINEYDYNREYTIRNSDTKAKVGEGIQFFTKEEHEQITNRKYTKSNDIDLSYSIETFENLGKITTYGKAKVRIVDLRKTVLTNEGF